MSRSYPPYKDLRAPIVDLVMVSTGLLQGIALIAHKSESREFDEERRSIIEGLVNSSEALLRTIIERLPDDG
jgi:hypothetical protein